MFFQCQLLRINMTLWFDAREDPFSENLTAVIEIGTEILDITASKQISLPAVEKIRASRSLDQVRDRTLTQSTSFGWCIKKSLGVRMHGEHINCTSL